MPHGLIIVGITLVATAVLVAIAKVIGGYLSDKDQVDSTEWPNQ